MYKSVCCLFHMVVILCLFFAHPRWVFKMEYLKKIKYLKQQIDELKAKNDALHAQLDITKSQKAKLEEEGFSKADLIRQIRNLEGKIKND